MAAVRPGLEALGGQDRELIADGQRERVGDSLDLDEVTRQGHARERRWDYILCVPDRHRLVGLEPHSPAKESEIDVVIEKKAQARRVLQPHPAPPVPSGSGSG